MEVDLSSALKNLRTKLRSIIDVDNRLLDKLCQDGVLTRERTATKLTVDELLDSVIKLPAEKQEKFLSALEDTGQLHVANYIIHNGKRPVANEIDWPIYELRQWKSVEDNWYVLLELIDSETGLVEKLLSKRCITLLRKNEINGHDKLIDRNEQLLRAVQFFSVASYRIFIDCLLETKQSRVVLLLEPGLAGNVQPLSEQRKELLQRNYLDLLDLISCDELLDFLYHKEVLTKQQFKNISQAGSSALSNERLLDTLLRRSQSDYDIFLEGLRKTEQQSVIDLLSDDDAVTAKLRVLNIDDTNRPQNEQKLEEMFSRLTPEERKQWFIKINETLGPEDKQTFMVQLPGGQRHVFAECQLVMMDKHSSIRLFYLCKSLPTLIKLYELHSTSECRAFVQKFFKTLLNNEQTLVVDKVVWDQSNFNKCMHHLYSLAGRVVYPKIYQSAEKLSDQIIEPLLTSISFELIPNPSNAYPDRKQVPHELIECMLIKAAVIMFVELSKLTSRAADCVRVALCAVSSYWNFTLTNRQRRRRIRKRLQRCFVTICRPFVYRQPWSLESYEHLQTHRKRETKLSCKNGYVIGMTEFNSKLYVVSSGSSEIQVFSVDSTFEPLESIKLSDNSGPKDIVGCITLSCLLFADSKKRCVTKVTADGSYSDLFTTDYEPRKLSVGNGGILVTPFDGFNLYIYDTDGKLKRKIELFETIAAHHAIETPAGTVIVCHTSRQVADRHVHTGVSELTLNGEGITEVKNYDSLLTLARPIYMTTAYFDSHLHLLVADRLEGRILHFNSSRQRLTRVLLEDLPSQPKRLHYSPQSGKLYIRTINSDEISIHDVGEIEQTSGK